MTFALTIGTVRQVPVYNDGTVNGVSAILYEEILTNSVDLTVPFMAGGPGIEPDSVPLQGTAELPN